MRPLVALDCETDPFKKGRIPRPFIWGMFDGVEFWHTEDLKLMIERLSDEKRIVYAHNGGKFDYHYMLDYLQPYDDILIINGRIAKFKIGNAEFRDSFNIIPTSLRSYEKEDFDYSLMESNVRYKTSNWRKIVSYLESDCENLFNMVTDFIDRYGMNLTQAGTAMKQWQKIYDVKAPRSSQEYYEQFSRFYYGGRVQCFKRGVINQRFNVFDINSAYPYAMLHNHPIGLEFEHNTGDTDHTDPDYGAYFFEVEAVANGCFPFRNDKGALVFPDDMISRIYHVTGWELQAARDTGTLTREKVISHYKHYQMTDFKEYITYFYNERQEAKKRGDKAGDLFSKLLMNSLYGKFGSNPDDYQSNIILPPDVVGELENSEYHFSGELGRWILGARDLTDEEKRYYNVATSASITGFVRAYLFRALHSCGSGNILYCDTDSIATTCKGNQIKEGDKLGQWKNEGEFDKAGIGGKKLYIFRGIPVNGERQYKTASKGAKLSHSQLWRIANGGEVIYQPENPTYSVHNGINFVDRKIRMTF